MPNPEKYASLSELSPEEQEQYKNLEQATDELYRRKVELRAIYDRVLAFLPEITNEFGSHPATWEDLQDWQSQDQLGKKLRPQVEKTIQSQRGPEIRDEEQEADVENIFTEIQEGLSLKKDVDQEENNQMLRLYKGFRLRELAQAKRELSALEAQLARNEAKRRYLAQKGTASPSYIRKLNEEYGRLYQMYVEAITTSPEGYLWKAGQQLLEVKKTFDEHGTIVETAYVREKIAHIIDEVKTGRPIFIHGELSTGKTELAKHIARKYLSSPHLARWEASHPQPTDPKELEKWEDERQLQREPLEIRGMRGLEKDDILAKTVLAREEVPLPEAQVAFLHQAVQDFMPELEKLAESITDPKEKQDYLQHLKQDYERGIIERWKSGIITLEKLSPIFQAMKEGRPVLVDEMNAIPHHVLIVLNDIINKRPGQTVTTPAGETFKIHEGFAIIATGNWKPEDSLLYVGRQPIDAAFLSRFCLEHYDYLPQAVQATALISGGDRETKRRERQENELYMMLMVRLLDSELGAKIPENAAEQIFHLAMVSRILQDVFSDKAVDRACWAKGGTINPKEVLKENVLAYRQLIPIIEKWKKDGFMRPLDDYLFLEYVYRSEARPQEIKYIYELLKTVGGFFTESEWPSYTGTSDTNISAILNFPIVRRMYGVDQLTGKEKPKQAQGAELRYLSPKEVIEIIFGPSPERRKFPRTRLPEVESEETEDLEAKRRIWDELDDLQEKAAQLQGIHREVFRPWNQQLEKIKDALTKMKNIQQEGIR